MLNPGPMRSPLVVPAILVLGIVTVAVVVLLVAQSMSLRDELRQARDEVAALQARVEQIDTVSPDALRREL